MNSNSKKSITVIDTFGFLFRSYYALPPLKSNNGFPTGLLTGFMNFILNIGKDFQTDYIVFALDCKGETFRHNIYPAYKENRQEAPQDLLDQLPIAISFIEKMGFKTSLKLGYEADDIIASICKDAINMNLNVRVVSHDKDLYQVIQDEKVNLFDPIKKITIDESKCFDKYGIYPSQFIQYQALLGDSSDNVPGVKGIGVKSAQALISEFNNIDNIYKNIYSVPKTRWIKLLQESKEMAYISKELVTLKDDLNILSNNNLNEFLLPIDNPILKIKDLLKEYDLNNILKKVETNGLNYKTNIPNNINIENKNLVNFNSILLDDEKKLFEILNSIKKDDLVSFDTETTSTNTKIAKIVGFSFSFDRKNAYYVPIGHNYLGVSSQIDIKICKKAINLLNNHKLVLQNFKFDYEIIKYNFNIELNLYVDTMILAWLLDPSSKIGLDYLSKKYFDYTTISFKDIVKKDENFSNVDISKACQYACEDAYLTKEIYYKQLDEFKYKNIDFLIAQAKDIEFDFIKVLSSMQEIGIKVDIKLLEELKIKNEEQLKYLTSKIYELAQTQFNINSPKQLGEILFEKLNLPKTKKTKTGYSTNESVLQTLINKHAIIDFILKYRETFKLQSTYIEPLLKLSINDINNRIYTSFLQTGTSTGRLSSKEPNLQNIPVRTLEGRQIRECFIAKDGYSLIGIDYSQIELRLLAHFSKDAALCDAFNNDLDIHTQTAIKIFGKHQAIKNRNIAKTINFGLIYGMGSSKLAKTLNISTKDAKEYIKSYFDAFTSVKDYLKSVEEFILEKAYIDTLLKRRRYFNIKSASQMFLASYLREGVNTKFQGSAADLIKLSMNKIYKKYKSNDDIKMLLQIHDELIFEVRDDKIDLYSKELKYIMENIYKLNIPLQVTISIGKNWGKLK
jgi:DNA polymerase I